ncbi:hypothetical protein DEMA109039_08745 [Deinococcus marmoris]
MVSNALNGQLSKTLRDVVPISTLHAYGAFFTSDSMADKLIEDLTDEQIMQSRVFDASCGGGNLLLAYARRLPVQRTLNATVLAWGEQIYGFDIQPSFIRSTRARLVLLAAYRGSDLYGDDFFADSREVMEQPFPHLRVCDALNVDWPHAEITLLNPPYNRVQSLPGCTWATGKVSQAANFIVKALEKSRPGDLVHAILPDVLRAGSNYRSWREEISQSARIAHINILGQFDADTGVDVFRCIFEQSAEILERRSFWPSNVNDIHLDMQTKLGDFFDISVGRVVPHRDKEVGKEYPYLHAKVLEPWAVIRADKEFRRFTGTTSQPPFVIIRRSSRSSDSYRAVGTVVRRAGSENTTIAVENHLLIVRPKSGLLRDCKELLKRLKMQQTNDWLNERIRCRHLTVGSVRDLPWWDV